MKITTMSRDEHKHAFFCPGCGFAHWFKTDGGGWTWNGDRDKPTISPSVLAWASTFRCHSFVTAGRIRFLDDCTHNMRGQTVDLPEFPGSSNAEHEPRRGTSRSAPCSCSVWPCPTCGAVDWDDAGNKCKADWVCSADDQRQLDYEREQSTPNNSMSGHHGPDKETT